MEDETIVRAELEKYELTSSEMNALSSFLVSEKKAKKKFAWIKIKDGKSTAEEVPQEEVRINEKDEKRGVWRDPKINQEVDVKRVTVATLATYRFYKNKEEAEFYWVKVENEKTTVEIVPESEVRVDKKDETKGIWDDLTTDQKVEVRKIAVSTLRKKRSFEKKGMDKFSWVKVENNCATIEEVPKNEVKVNKEEETQGTWCDPETKKEIPVKRISRTTLITYHGYAKRGAKQFFSTEAKRIKRKRDEEGSQENNYMNLTAEEIVEKIIENTKKKKNLSSCKAALETLDLDILKEIEFNKKFIRRNVKNIIEIKKHIRNLIVSRQTSSHYDFDFWKNMTPDVPSTPQFNLNIPSSPQIEFSPSELFSFGEIGEIEKCTV